MVRLVRKHFFILASVIEPLLDRKLLLLLWKLMEDSESYIRASSICLLGVLSTHDVSYGNITVKLFHYQR